MSKIKFISAFLLLFVLASFAVKAQPSTQVGGLFYSPQTQESFYIEWDKAGGLAAKIFWSKGNAAYKRFEVMSQVNRDADNLFPDNALNHYIQIWEKAKPNVSYELNFVAVGKTDYTVIYMNKKGSATKTVFLQIAPQGSITFNPKTDKPNTLLANAVSKLKWNYANPLTGAVNSDINVFVESSANKFVVTTTENEQDMVFRSLVNADLSISCKEDSQPSFPMTMKLEITDDKKWEIYLYAPSDEVLMLLVHNTAE
jgi:hypothetical protein